MPRSRLPRILLLIPHLGGGGAEQVIETLARSLNPTKYDVHLCLVTGQYPHPVKLPASVTIHKFSALRVRRSFFQLFALVRRTRPDLILSGIAHLNLLVLALRPVLPRKTRILVRHNGELSAILSSLVPRWMFRKAYAFAYRRADRVICQTDSMAAEIRERLGVTTHKLTILRNPIELSDFRAEQTALRSLWTGSGPHILAMGRLAPEKGFDLLLKAFAAVLGRYPGAELIIAGSGQCESRLKEQAFNLGLENQARLIGHRDKPAELFGEASLFVLSSRTEGLPNALLEAAAARLPIVATPASRGLVDLLRDKEGVWLAAQTSSSALCAALCQALSAIQPRQRYPHSWIEPFDASVTLPAYERVLGAALQERD